MSDPDHPKKYSAALTVRSTPFAHDPEDAAIYYEALGRAVFLWGCFEASFDSCLMIIRNIAGPETQATEFPIAWKRKAEFWRGAFKTMPQLSAYRDHALKLIKEAVDTAQVRHKLFHGHFESFVSSEPLTARLRTIRHKKGLVVLEAYSVTLDDLEGFAGDADALNTALVPYMWNLSRLQPALQTIQKDE